MARSARKKRRRTAYSTAIAASQGSAMSPANRVKDSPLAVNASRLVKLDTGRSSDAELARCAVAYTCGRARAPALDAVASTTGVSRTTVASRLSTAVTGQAIANTPASRRRGLPPQRRATIAPTASKRPSFAHRCARTSTRARKTTTGSRVRVCSHAWCGVTVPSATASAAAGTAAAASGRPRGAARRRPARPAAGRGARPRRGRWYSGLLLGKDRMRVSEATPSMRGGPCSARWAPGYGAGGIF